MFIRLNIDIFSYANKYQVLIVNSTSINHNFMSQGKEDVSPISNQSNSQNIMLNPMAKLLTNLLLDKNVQTNQAKVEESKIKGAYEKYAKGGGN